MTSREIGHDPIKYVAMHFCPFMSYEIGRNLIVIGHDIF